MNKNVNRADLQGHIQSMLIARNPGVNIVKVEVRDGVDFDGDDILRIDVIFEGRPSDFNKQFLVSAIRNVIEKLSENEIDEFPVISYIPAKDADNRSARLAACH